MASSSSKLLVTAKGDLPTAVRQLQRWASIAWHPIVYTTSWADYGSGFQTGRYCVDPFGFVVVEGMAQYSGGAIAALSTVTITTLPKGFAPPAEQPFPPGAISGIPRVDVYTDGTIRFVNATTSPISNPYVPLSGIRYAPFL